MTTVAVNANTEAPKKDETTPVAVNGEATEKKSNTENNGGDSEIIKKNRIQVSNTKKPLFFYVNLAKVSISLSSNVILISIVMGHTRRL